MKRSMDHRYSTHTKYVIEKQLPVKLDSLTGINIFKQEVSDLWVWRTWDRAYQGLE